jgi:hypothetical protein
MDIITEKLMTLVNTYPRLEAGETIEFSVLDEDGGIAFFPTSGAAVERSDRDVLGHTEQIITYPFMVIYRANGLSESNKVDVKEWLDDLGRWMEGQPIVVDGVTYVITLPTLDANRRFTTIRRSAPSALNAINDNQTEDWAISIIARYSNEF